MKKYFDSRIELKLKVKDISELLDENFYGKTFNSPIKHYKNTKGAPVTNNRIVLEEDNTKRKRP